MKLQVAIDRTDLETAEAMIEEIKESADIILLGDQKSNDHLPEVLPEDPYSLSPGRRDGQIPVSGIDLPDIPAVIIVQVKIRNPDTE